MTIAQRLWNYCERNGSVAVQYPRISRGSSEVRNAQHAGHRIHPVLHFPSGSDRVKVRGRPRSRHRDAEFPPNKFSKPGFDSTIVSHGRRENRVISLTVG